MIRVSGRSLTSQKTYDRYKNKRFTGVNQEASIGNLFDSLCCVFGLADKLVQLLGV